MAYSGDFEVFLINTEKTSNKFYYIKLNNKQVITEYGSLEIGSTKKETKTFNTTEEALKFVNKTYTDKINKDYIISEEVKPDEFGKRIQKRKAVNSPMILKESASTSASSNNNNNTNDYDNKTEDRTPKKAKIAISEVEPPPLHILPVYNNNSNSNSSSLIQQHIQSEGQLTIQEVSNLLLNIQNKLSVIVMTGVDSGEDKNALKEVMSILLNMQRDILEHI